MYKCFVLFCNTPLNGQSSHICGGEKCCIIIIIQLGSISLCVAHFRLLSNVSVTLLFVDGVTYSGWQGI